MTTDPSREAFEKWFCESGMTKYKETAWHAWQAAMAHKEVERWQSIETAPKDGTWLMLWRTPEPESSPMHSNPLILARWSMEYEEFVWPDSPYDAFTPWGRQISDAIVEDGRRIFGSVDFTHWMPLPAAPLQHADSINTSAERVD